MNGRKRWIAWFLTAVLTIGVVAGCTNANSGDAGGSNSGNEGAAPPAQTDTPAAEAPEKPPEPVTLTYGAYHVISDTMDNFDQTAAGKAIKQQLNITLKIRGSQNTDQDLIADMAANNLPDIFVINSGAQPNLEIVLKAANEGMLADLSGVLQSGAAPLLSEVLQPERMPMFAQRVTFNPEYEGKMYFLPSYYSTAAPAVNGFGLYLRGDIAAALNVDPASLRTSDDLYNLAKTIKTGDFKDVNGRPVFPIGMIGPWDENLYQLFREFDYGRSGFALIDGQIKSFIESEEIWQQILFARKLVSEGLIDPESFAHSYQIGSEKVSQGRNAIMPFLAAAVVPGNQAVMKALTDPHPEMTYVGLSPMNDFTGSSDQVLNIGMEKPVLVAVSKNANAEAAVRLLDWINTKDGRGTVWYGEKDAQWFFNDQGFAQMTDEAYQELAADLNAYMGKYGANGSFLTVASMITGFDAKYDIFGGTTRSASYQNNPGIADNTLAYVQQVMPNIVVKNQLDISTLMDAYPGKDQLSPVLLQLNDTLARAYLVQSENEAKDILDGYRNTLNRSGYQEYVQYLQQEYDKDPSAYLVSSGKY